MLKEQEAKLPLVSRAWYVIVVVPSLNTCPGDCPVRVFLKELVTQVKSQII